MKRPPIRRPHWVSAPSIGPILVEKAFRSRWAAPVWSVPPGSSRTQASGPSWAPMFLQFFTSLREAQVPVTLREYLTLMEALNADLAERTVEHVYYLSRDSLVQDERNLDKFDR